MKQKDRITQYSFIIWAFFLIAFFSASAQAATHYVSATGSASWANSTNISTPCSLATALAKADDDDIVYLRGGTYDRVYRHGVLEPDNSGSKGHPITFKAYLGETPIIDGTNTDSGYSPIGLTYRSYITIDGLTVSNSITNWSVTTGGAGSYMTYDIIIQNCTFNTKGVYSKNLDGLQILDNTFSNITYAGVNISGHNIYKSTNTKISGNTFTGTFAGTDAITLHTAFVGIELHGIGNYHLIENNTITKSGNTSENCIDIESGSYVVVRNNICTGPGTSPGIIVAGKNHEGNKMDYVRIIGNTSYNLSSGQEHFFLSGEDRDNIQWIRNVAYGTGEHNLTLYNSLSLSSDGMRVAHNAFDGRELRDSPNFTVMRTSGGGVTDVSEKNNIFITKTDDPDIYLFKDLGGRDYSLQSGSPAIDAGGWLTAITSATGSGRSFKVDDPLWFYDGWNITGEIGDTIKTENGQTATITSINYSTGAITVDRSISWTNGEGIGLDYKGIMPDIGAKEYLSGNLSILPPPGTLHIIN